MVANAKATSLANAEPNTGCTGKPRQNQSRTQAEPGSNLGETKKNREGGGGSGQIEKKHPKMVTAI